jgi:hypothetical protein
MLNIMLAKTFAGAVSGVSAKPLPLKLIQAELLKMENNFGLW